MRFILYSWQANNEQILADNLIKMGFEVVWFRKECKHYTRDMELAMEMIQAVHREAAEAVVSFNYFPIVSMICHTCEIPYYAWVYDCPHFTLYAKQVCDSCNHIGIFDREMVRRLEEDYDINTLHHAPLAVDCAYFEEAIARASRGKREKYQCDVSFVGSLYTDEHNYYELLFDGERDAAASDCGRMEALIKQQCFSYEKDYLRQAVTSGQIHLEELQKSMEEQGLMLGEDYFARPEDILIAAVLEKKVTVEERWKLLTGIMRQLSTCDSSVMTDGRGTADRNLDFRLYTGSDTGKLPELNAHNHGTVDYHTQMPLVFAGSRINLNISLRSIHSGIPLRVLDIMACGGFVLSNRQPEVTEYFEEGVEIATFGSMEECIDKVHYYLSHEEERKQIAEAGQRKVKEEFSYEAGLSRLFEV
ncbi:MAG: glycosyltransferase [Lachnospiraceae bacterium]|nr:glycosyltransferase [Lachnospiraceae bacterium]